VQADLVLRFKLDDGDESLRVGNAVSSSGIGQGYQNTIWKRAAQRALKANEGGEDKATSQAVQDSSTVGSPQKKKTKDANNMSNKKNKSGEKRAHSKRQLPPLAQRKGRSSKGTSSLSKSSPAKPGGKQAMTPEQKSQ